MYSTSLDDPEQLLQHATALLIDTSSAGSIALVQLQGYFD